MGNEYLYLHFDADEEMFADDIEEVWRIRELTEAVLLTTKRKIAPISFQFQNKTITPTKAVKHLGVRFNRKIAPISFQFQNKTITPTKAVKHLGVRFNTKQSTSTRPPRRLKTFKALTKLMPNSTSTRPPRRLKTFKALTKLMPNIGGPRPSKREFWPA
ncbi:hypothetical protein QE152_g174 [Popillia japonica]|uniref:Uncharacterized protein n=1 Tax=Popillia japonica TaxID=7064 RepID=A0AAW1NMU9_POPJA